MRLKAEVRFKTRQMAMLFAITVIESIFKRRGYELVITSFADGVHGVGSLHSLEGAVDFRSWHIPTKEEKLSILKEIKDSLTVQFDVLLEHLGLEQEHYHCEFDPD